MLGGLYWLALPKSTDSTAGIPTNRLMPVTSLAVVLVGAIWRNKNRSKARPTRGAQDQHRQDEGQPHREVLVLDQPGEQERRQVGLGAVGEIEHAGGLVGEDQSHGHDGIGAPVGDPGYGESQEVLHAGAGFYRVPATGSLTPPGFPAGGVTTLGLLTLALTQTKTCLPGANTGT